MRRFDGKNASGNARSAAALIGLFLAIASAGIGWGSPYGALQKQPRTDFRPAIDPAAVSDEWRKADFYIIETDLSPAILAYAKSPKIRLFSHLDSSGEGAPSFLAVPTAGGIAVRRNPARLDGANQNEAWLLVWFAGAPGWTAWDVPWLAVLQHRARTIALDREGLGLEFEGPCGHIAAMPLYGYYKPPQKAAGDFLALHGLPSRGIETWRWADGLPRDVVARCRWWASASREFPLGSRETFSINRRTDTLSIREEFRYLSINDDWGTPHIKFGPISPALGLAWLGRTFPMRVTPPLHDPDLFTPFGPLVGTVGSDRLTIEFPGLLKYVNEVEIEQPAPPTNPIAAEAQSRVADKMRRKFRTDDWNQIWDHGGSKNFCWQVVGDHWYAKALPYCDPATRRHAKQALHDYFAQFVLREEHYKPRRGRLLLVGPGIGVWSRNGFDDAGKFSTNLLKTIWNYAHYTGDWELIRRRWALIARFFVTPYEMDWRSFGRYSIAEQGDEAGPAMCFARLAWAVGDTDNYLFGCYVFVRELVHHYIKMKGAAYFRRNQPYDSMEWMPQEVYLTNLWGSTAGWRIDGPTYPKKTGERQYNNRWVRLSEPEIGRFYRDVLARETRAEMDLLAKRPACPYKPDRDAAHIAPSLIRLRSLLLNEPPEALARITPPEKARVSRGADTIAFYLSYVRTARPPRWDRIIAADGGPTPYVLGLERIRESGSHCPVVVVSWRLSRDPRAASFWPIFSWWGWKPPRSTKGGSRRATPPLGRWSFGQIVPGNKARPENLKSQALNWNTTVIWEAKAP